MPAAGYLPADLTSLVGRVKEGREVRKLLGKARLVTLTGPGGVGKTRIALHVGRTAARAFPDGVWLVELATLHDPAMLDATVATVLGHEDVTGHQANLADRLRTWRGLVILDNCEHLVEACARLTHELLAGAPRSPASP
jgi:predicted ATPase